jgi:hypothetical protein
MVGVQVRMHTDYTSRLDWWRYDQASSSGGKVYPIDEALYFITMGFWQLAIGCSLSAAIAGKSASLPGQKAKDRTTTMDPAKCVNAHKVPNEKDGEASSQSNNTGSNFVHNSGDHGGSSSSIQLTGTQLNNCVLGARTM